MSGCDAESFAHSRIRRLTARAVDNGRLRSGREHLRRRVLAPRLHDRCRRDAAGDTPATRHLGRANIVVRAHSLSAQNRFDRVVDGVHRHDPLSCTSGAHVRECGHRRRRQPTACVTFDNDTAQAANAAAALSWRRKPLPSPPSSTVSIIYPTPPAYSACQAIASVTALPSSCAPSDAGRRRQRKLPWRSRGLRPTARYLDRSRAR